MSPSVLLYSKIRRITAVDNMILIMIVGNQLYSSLSLLKRQSLLMLTELPVFERLFQLEYNESYNIFRVCTGMRIYMSLKVYILPTLKLIFFQAALSIVVYQELIVTNVPVNSAVL